MSSPLSSLNKNKKSPLNPAKSFGKRSMPFRGPDASGKQESEKEDENQSSSKPKHPSSTPTRRKKKSSDSDGTSKNFLASTANQPVSPILNSIRKSYGSKASSPNDIELLSTMVKRITQLEKQTAYYTKEVFEKDKRIKVLEEKLALSKKAKARETATVEKNSKVEDLEAKCYYLQKQVDEMETFLSDYGMVWIGESPNHQSPNSANAPVIQTSPTPRRNEFYDKPSNFNIDYDRIIRNVKDLNMIAGEGLSKIEKTKDGARLKQQESVPLTLYANGIWMFNGPFRSIEEYSTMRCLGDLMDGYFPTELQSLYPNGVPLKITDKRDTIFKDPRASKGFPGLGRMLQSSHSPFPGPSEDPFLNQSSPSPNSRSPSPHSRSLSPHSRSPSPHSRSISPHSMDKYEISSKIPGPLLTTDQFLGRLPNSVVQDGKVLPIRSSLREHITDADGQATSNEVVEADLTEVGDQKRNSPDSDEITTVRIKSEDGGKTYILKMRFSDTIGDLRKHLDRIRSRSFPMYDIMSTFPMQKHNDLAKTLVESGLTPNGTLHLKKKR